MKTTILIFLMLYSCIDRDIEYNKPITELEPCSRAFVEHVAISNYYLFQEIYGEYAPMDTLSGHSIVINRNGQYFHVVNDVIVSGGDLLIFRDNTVLTAITTNYEPLIEGTMLYCDETLVNKTLGIKFCLICKCEL